MRIQIQPHTYRDSQLEPNIGTYKHAREENTFKLVRWDKLQFFIICLEVVVYFVVSPFVFQVREPELRIWPVRKSGWGQVSLSVSKKMEAITGAVARVKSRICCSTSDLASVFAVEVYDV
jgi:hypothetical protein